MGAYTSQKLASQELNQQFAKDTVHKESYAQVIIKLAMEVGSLSFMWATMLVNLFVIFVLEVLGMFVGADYRRYKNALPHYFPNLSIEHEIKGDQIRVDERERVLSAIQDCIDEELLTDEALKNLDHFMNIRYSEKKEV